MKQTLPLDLKNETREPSPPFQLSAGRRASMRLEKHYRPSDELVDAVKVALLLRKPLLVTGEPGTGKTELGRYLAWKMGLECHQFDAKSNSQAQDLYYTYDALGRYQARQSGDVAEARSYLRFNALGGAILQVAQTTEELRRVLPDQVTEVKRQSVVVIDEIDKAPRDFPNDLLNELDAMFFHVPPLSNLKITAEKGYEPILVITSNSEKNLPPAFLRRCVYFHIDFPKLAELQVIAGDRVAEFEGSPALDDALGLFLKLRAENLLQKRPATAELLDWLLAMSAGGVDPLQKLSAQRQQVLATLPALVKHEADRAAARELAQKQLG